MTIYTRGGDDGETSLGDGLRVAKTDPRVEAYGTIDEATSTISVARALTTDPFLSEVLAFCQHRLMNCSSRIATPLSAQMSQSIAVDEDDLEFLERVIDRLEEVTGPLDGFLVPGATLLSAQLHVGRTVVRRAERRVLAMNSPDDIDRSVARFLNRLSDALFAAARYAVARENAIDELWDRELPRPPL